ncbi:hypothetical protein H4V97_000323 [Flavobacterium sp. CG_23.5]|nr:hypothetical protein [Flavobacterium sp. CG_23.5]
MESNFLIKSITVNVIRISYDFFINICAKQSELINDFIIGFTFYMYLLKAISPRTVLVCKIFFNKNIFT